ncbi:hypothetical protein CHS0354_027886 [Potamilus streckersoni]|uniref:Uncharacterized protein n=1 Tax=Potamilus streckersoni TaxID=2493646 RepID=A0AAE0T3F5_9BIVA|nr:hypothetical protein CHS0354_027886 [Potamilus streckersoni]
MFRKAFLFGSSLLQPEHLQQQHHGRGELDKATGDNLDNDFLPQSQPVVRVSPPQPAAPNSQEGDQFFESIDSDVNRMSTVYQFSSVSLDIFPNFTWKLNPVINMKKRLRDQD